MSGVFQFAVRSQTDMDSKLTSVERVSYYYKNIKQESINDSNELSNEWPKTGEINFSNVVLRYKNDAKPALDDLSFNIKNVEKIGVVGRTGSGILFFFKLNTIKLPYNGTHREGRYEEVLLYKLGVLFFFF